MVVQYCQTYTDREDGKYSLRFVQFRYGSWKGCTHRTNRTIREKDLKAVFHFNRIVAKRSVFHCVHIISFAWVLTKYWNTLRFATIRLKWKTGLRPFSTPHVSYRTVANVSVNTRTITRFAFPLHFAKRSETYRNTEYCHSRNWRENQLIKSKWHQCGSEDYFLDAKKGDRSSII